MGYDTYYEGAIKFDKPFPLATRLQFLALMDKSRHRLRKSKLPIGPLDFHLVTQNNTNACDDDYETILLAAKDPVPALLVFHQYYKNQDNKKHLEWLKFLLQWFKEKGFKSEGRWCAYGEEEKDRYEVRVVDCVAFVASEIRYAAAEPKSVKKQKTEEKDGEGNGGDKGEEVELDDEDEEDEEDDYVNPATSLTAQECRVFETECRQVLVGAYPPAEESDSEGYDWDVFHENRKLLTSDFSQEFLDTLKACCERDLKSFADDAFRVVGVPNEYKEFLFGRLVSLRLYDVDVSSLDYNLGLCTSLKRLQISKPSVIDAANRIAEICPNITQLEIGDLNEDKNSSVKSVIELLESFSKLPLVKLEVLGLSFCLYENAFSMLKLFPKLKEFKVELDWSKNREVFGKAPTHQDPQMMLLQAMLGGGRGGGLGDLFGGGIGRVPTYTRPASVEGNWLAKIAELSCALTLETLDLGAFYIANYDLVEAFVEPKDGNRAQAEAPIKEFKFPHLKYVQVRPVDYESMYPHVTLLEGSRPELRFKLAEVPSKSFFEF
ncbi:UNVERIFIED_CONTAM: hypothetical protein HDU68_008545 [Siphonaria sp. JEL0065]|nr:hypothetical protein HDU68_008545 [Siphonaria sp. JEL0065]